LVRSLVIFAICFALPAASFGIAYQWESNATNNWNSATHWAPDGVPGNSLNDTVVIDVTGSYTVTLNVDPANPLDSFTLDSSDATFFLNSHTLTVNGPSTLTDGSVVFQNANWAGTGTLTNYAAISMSGSCEVSTSSFDQNNTLTLGSPTGGHTTLTVANDLNNAGTLTMTSVNAGYYSYLKVNDTLTNSGTIDIFSGVGGAREIHADIFNNTGTINVNTHTTFTKPIGGTNGIYNNSGDLNILLGKTLTISGNSQIFNQNAGTLDINGTFDLSDITFNYNGGTIDGTPQLRNSSLYIDSGATNAASFLLYGNSTLTGQVVNSGQTLMVQGASLGSHATLTTQENVNNSGTITLESVGAGYSCTLEVNRSGGTVDNGILTNTSSGILNVEQGAAGLRYFKGSLINNGNVNINHYNTYFSQSGGSYTNNNKFNIDTGKKLTISGNNQTFIQNAGTLTIDGTFELSNMDFDYNGGLINGTPEMVNVDLYIGPIATNPTTFRMRGTTNTLDGNVHLGQTILVHGEGGLGTLTSDNDFSNAGTITLESIGAGYTCTLDVDGSGGTVNNGVLTNELYGVLNFEQGAAGVRYFKGSLVNNGTVNINHYNTIFVENGGNYTNYHNFNIATGKELTISGSAQTFNQNAGTLTIDGTLDLSTMPFNYNGGTIDGIPDLRNVDLTIAPTATNYATFRFTSTGNTLTGDVHLGQTLLVYGEGGLGALTSDNDFSNSGTITVQSIGAGYACTLDVNDQNGTVYNGTLTNQPNGIINLNQGDGGIRYFKGSLDNRGTFNVNNTDTIFTEPDATYTNRGTFNVGIGKKLSITGSNQTFIQESGTLNIDGTLELSSMAMEYKGGHINGNALSLRNVDLTIHHTTIYPATFNMTSIANTLTGNVNPGIVLNVLGDGGAATLTSSSNNLYNEGTITLETVGAGYSCTLDADGSVVNMPSGIINMNYGDGGYRYLKAALINDGTVNWNVSGYLGEAGVTHDNNGKLNIGGSSTNLYVQGNLFFNSKDGVIAGNGTLDVKGLTFLNLGEVSPGFSAGILTIHGIYNQEENSAVAGSLNIEIGGVDVGTEYDRLVVKGDANLDGLLEISFINGFVPAPSDTFTILTADAIGGQFSNAMTTIQVGQGTFDVTYTNNSVTLSNYVVPEPSTIALLFSVLLATPLLYRRHKR
jgi:hypothetical protein